MKTTSSLRRAFMSAAFTLGILANGVYLADAGTPSPYTAFTSGTGTMPTIILSSSMISGTTWAAISPMTSGSAYTKVSGTAYSRYYPIWSAARYLNTGLQQMATGTDSTVTTGTCNIISGTFNTGTTHGIILTTLSAMPASDPLYSSASTALAATGTTTWNAAEAFYVHTNSNCATIVANTSAGLVDGAVEFLLGDNAQPGYQIGYEVLSMGPDWTFSPNYSTTALTFDMDYASRPGYYTRLLAPQYGQQRGIGTISSGSIPGAMPPPDEQVELSYDHWQAGARLENGSLPLIGGEAAYGYHDQTVRNMITSSSTNGFLCATGMGPSTSQPVASSTNAGMLWVSTSGSNSYITSGTVYYCALSGTSGTYKWTGYTPFYAPIYLDYSATTVQQALLSGTIMPSGPDVYLQTPGLLVSASNALAANPSSPAQFNIELEDGGTLDTQFQQYVANRDWYYNYRQTMTGTSSYGPNGPLYTNPWSLNVSGSSFFFGEPYQPTESWWSRYSPANLANAQSDNIFAMANWLLNQFDQQVGSNVTSTGQTWSSLINVTLNSYNWHDVPPDFNIDSRVRVMVAGLPKHQGAGNWVGIGSQADMGRAFYHMNPSQPTTNYNISTTERGDVYTLSGIDGNQSTTQIQTSIADGDFAGLSATIGFNFGEMALQYYLMAKEMWNPALTAGGTTPDSLDYYRTRWIQRAYGDGTNTGWSAQSSSIMQEYYDLTQQGNWVDVVPFYSQAISLIQQADNVISANISSPGAVAAENRLHDLEQSWYWYYLNTQYPVRSGTFYTVGSGTNPAPAALQQFVWQGQSAYTTDMYWITEKYFNNTNPEGDAGSTYYTSSTNYTAAHFSGTASAGLWAQVTGYAPWQNAATFFLSGTLANGELASQVDINDVVQVPQFQSGTIPDSPLITLPGGVTSPAILTVAQSGQTIGFQMGWPWFSGTLLPALYGQKNVDYNISYWNAADQLWETVSQGAVLSNTTSWGPNEQWFQVNYSAPMAGTYGITLGPDGPGADATIASLSYNFATGTYSGSSASLTYYQNVIGTTNVKNQYTYFYIPKNTPELDLQIMATGSNNLQLYNGLPATGLTVSRTITGTLNAPGVYKIPLNSGEAGSIARLQENGNYYFYCPYLYSVPMIWSKSPSTLLVPRDIAIADGLIPTNTMYVSGNDINQVGLSGTATGQVTSFASSGGFGMVLSSGTLYCVDYNLLKRFNSNGTYSYVTGPTFNCAGLAMDGGGNFYASSGSSIVKFTSSGTVLNSSFATMPDAGASQMVFDSSGNLWVSDYTSSKVVEFTSTGTLIKTIAVTDACGLAFDQANNLYVSCDTTAGKIYKVVSGGTSATAIVTSGLNDPYGLAYYNGILYVANSGNSTIKTVNLSNNSVSTFATLSYAPTCLLISGSSPP